MITRSFDTVEHSNWQSSLQQAIQSIEQLLAMLALSIEQLPYRLKPGAKHFALKVPISFVSRMKKGDPFDPLLLQVLPLADEQTTASDFSFDPLQEQSASPVPGLLHKYHGRVLLLLTGACAIHCRYCFRQHFSYSEHAIGEQRWQQIKNYLQNDHSINEIIFSGGDPLSVTNEKLQKYLLDLEKITHIKRARFHTRFPVVLPERVDYSFLTILDKTPLQKIIVLHINHPNEINNDVLEMIKLLKEVNVTLLNQSVLLKNINNNAETLIALSEKLFAANVLPYYLHLTDKTQGTQHFEVSELEAKKLVKQMTQKLPGFLVPKLAREVPEYGSKEIIT